MLIPQEKIFPQEKYKHYVSAHSPEKGTPEKNFLVNP